MAARQTILVTGATDGLGRRVAEMLASPDVLLLVHGRNAERGRSIVEAVEAAGGSAIFYQADLSSLEAVRRMGETIAAEHPHLDLVINNAGIAIVTGPRLLSVDGHELHFAVNYLAPFLLTRMLRPALGKHGPSRVINVASAGQAPIDFDNVMLEREYDGFRAYRQSKLADIMFTFDLSREFEGSNVTSTSLHPGTYLDTTMVRSSGIEPLNTVDSGAEAVLALVHGSTGAVSGRYFDVKREARASAQAYDVDARRKLRALSLELTKGTHG